MRGGKQLLHQDVAGELESLMKCEGPDALSEETLPLLEIAMDAMGIDPVPIDEALGQLVAAGIDRVEPRPEREALGRLFLGENRWHPLTKRGPEAAVEVGLTYDAFRRRNKSGHRRLDSVLSKLAEAIIEVSRLDQHLGVMTSAQFESSNPGENVFERASVFLSYSRYDDEHEAGLVSALRERLISEFRFQTGQELFVFHDKASIDLGENWQRRLEEGIDAASFLLVVLTPSYLRSTACREELGRFLERERQRGRDDLVLPLYYASVPESTDDPLARVLLGRQYTDWRSLRFEPSDSPPVRRAIANLVNSLSTAIARTADATKPHSTQEAGVPGFLELVGEMNLALPRFVKSLMTMAAEQEELTEVVEESTAELNRLHNLGRGGAAQVIVARRLASRLDPYADRMEQSAETMRSSLGAIERGMRAMAEMLPTSTEEGIEEVARSMVVSMEDAHSASVQAAEAVESLSEIYVETGRIASTMRPVLHRLVAAIKAVAECPAKLETFIEIVQAAVTRRLEVNAMNAEDA